MHLTHGIAGSFAPRLLGLTIAGLCVVPLGASAQTAMELTGKISSAEEPVMEGVVVSAKKEGSPITVSVVSDAGGHYGFPASRLSPGHYMISIRAIGYDLTGTPTADLAAGHPVNVDLNLHKTANLADQLTSAEWLTSAPGTDSQKDTVANCVICHTFKRIVSSTHKADEWPQVFARMSGYSPGTQPVKPQLLPGNFKMGAGAGQEGANGSNAFVDAAKIYLASINLSQSPTWQYPLKTFPRPTGRATHVIYTEYDLPRPITEPHDTIVDEKGTVWYADFGEMFIGKLDPDTGKVTEYPVPQPKKDNPRGMLDLEEGSDGALWMATMFQGGVARFDRKTETFDFFPLPPDLNNDSALVPMVSPYFSNVDGKVWVSDGRADLLRVNRATGMLENLGRAKSVDGKTLGAYGIPTDSKNNLYQLNMGQAVGRVDAATGTLTVYETPTPASHPRRGHVDADDRLWFGEYGGNAIGMLDTKAKAPTIKEWRIPTPWSLPYDTVPAKNGDVWAGSMLSDRVSRLNPKTGQFVEYLLPKPTNIRRVFFDNPRNALWVGSNHGSSIVKIEPLD